MKSATFQPVGGAAMKYGDIKVSGNWGFPQDALQTLNVNGGTEYYLCYCNATLGEEYGCGEGWFDWNYINGGVYEGGPVPAEYDYTNREIPFGKMIILQTANDDVTIDFAGQVKDSASEFTLTTGIWNNLGNCSPVDLTFGDIVAGGSWGFPQDALQTLNGNGGTEYYLCYCNATLGEEYGCGEGWFDWNYINGGVYEGGPVPPEYDYTKKPVPSGMGFVLQTANVGATVEVPAAL